MVQPARRANGNVRADSYMPAEGARAHLAGTRVAPSGGVMALYNEVLPGFRRHPANIVLGGVRGGVNGTPTFFVTAARLSA